MTIESRSLLNPADVLALASALDQVREPSGVRALECICGETFPNATDFRTHLDGHGVKPSDQGVYFEQAERARSTRKGKP